MANVLSHILEACALGVGYSTAGVGYTEDPGCYGRLRAEPHPTLQIVLSIVRITLLFVHMESTKTTNKTGHFTVCGVNICLRAILSMENTVFYPHFGVG